MPNRKAPTPDVEADVLLASRRRCCICWGLKRDLSIKQGQLAHLSRDASDSDADNLAFMCLEHHDWYDTRTSQSKGASIEEARRYRAELYDELRRRDEAEADPTPARQSEAPAVRVSIPFERIDVDDERLKLRWVVRKSPQLWLGKYHVIRDLSPPVVKEILDGPFHAVPGCHERLTELPSSLPSGSHSPMFAESCPGCGVGIFTAVRIEAESRFVAVWPVRAQALAEIDRMHRLGVDIKGPRLALDNPQYWKIMLPSRS